MKKPIVLFILFFVIGGGLFFLKSAPSKTTLRVMVYSSFVNVFGPGPLIKKKFEEICDCRIKWLKVPDSTLFAQRLKLKKDGFKADVVLGLDQLSLNSVETLPWKEVSVSRSIWAKINSHLPVEQELLNGFMTIHNPQQSHPSPKLAQHPLMVQTYFVPYNWSPMSLLSRKKQEQALSLKDLLNPSFQHNISLPSPRTSTAGFQFYYWIWSVFKEQTGVFLKSFKSQLYGLSPSWSTSYSLFQRGHVDFSFSYLSSLLYHRQQKQTDFYFVFFKEGHPFQVEMAGVSAFCTECAWAKKFVLFLLKPEIQNILKTKNYMLPVIEPSYKDFPELRGLNLISYKNWPDFLDQKQKWLKKWDLEIK